MRCIGKAVVKHGLRGLAGLVPMGGELYDIACDAWTDYRAEGKEQELRAEIEEAARSSAAEARQVAEQVVREVAADQPPEVQVALTSYLSQVRATVRQSLRTPADPTGTTLPATRSLRAPEDLLPFLPQRLPRFKPGDRPLPSLDWELVELLGVGGFGEVWKARHLTLGSRKPVALKFCLDAAAAGALRNEAQLLDRVMQQGRHPGIVALLQTYLRADPPCLEYEFVEGGDLGGLMQEQMAQGASPQVAAQIIHRLAKTVAFAHRMSEPIVHRDLKPANILVQRKPDGKVTLLIADFGIGGVAAAQVIRQETGRPTTREQAMPTAVRGAYTPLYASPQQRRGEEPDPRDDVHALGVIWYQLLVGDLTAEGPSGKGWRKKLERRGMEPGLIALLESCIDDDADERPENADDLAGKIQGLLKLPRPPDTLTPPDPPVQPKAPINGANSRVSPPPLDPLRGVTSMQELLSSLRNFNSQAKSNEERARKIIRQTRHWVYDLKGSAFGPCKFVGFADLDFSRYAKALKDELPGESFNGGVAKWYIESLLGKTFERQPELHARLQDWADKLLGYEGVLADAKQEKWHFLILDSAQQTA